MATQGHSREVVVLSGKRTGFGTFGGSLKDFTATDLGVFSSTAAIEAAGLTPDQVDHTFIGNALQTSSDSIYLRSTRGASLRCSPGQARAHDQSSVWVRVRGHRPGSQRNRTRRG